MEHELTDQKLRITCLRDVDRFDEMAEAVSCGSREGCAEPGLHPWRGRLSLLDQDAMVLVSGHDDDRPLGVIAASLRATERELFLLVEAAAVSDAARDRYLLQRMIAFSIVSLARRDMTPSLVAACCRGQDAARSMGELGARFTAAVAFPDPRMPAIDLALARTARRIARSLRPEARYAAGSGTFYAANDPEGRLPQGTLVVLDLAASDEATIAADACRVVRERARYRPVYADPVSDDWRRTKRPLRGIARSHSPSTVGRPHS